MNKKTHKKLVSLLLVVGCVSVVQAKRIGCTAGAYEAEIARLNSSCSGYGANCEPDNGACTGAGAPAACCTGANSGTCDGSRNITWESSCSSVAFPRTNATTHQRDVKVDNVVIDGEDRITVLMSPDCDNNVDPPSTCSEGENADWFVKFMLADGGGVRNLTIKGFLKGVKVEGCTNTVTSNVTFEKICDTHYGSSYKWGQSDAGYNNVIRDSVFRKGCDKCIHNEGDAATLNISDPDDPEFYNIRIINNVFESCSQPVGPMKTGRALIQDNDIRAPGGGIYDCGGVSIGHPDFSGRDVAYFFNNTFDNCDSGNVRVRGHGEAYFWGNTFRNSRSSGVSIFDSGRAFFAHNTFEDNGGVSDGIPGFTGVGGLHVAVPGGADAGGGSIVIDGKTLSSPGHNAFIGNRSNSDPTMDVSNATSTMVKAEHNSWGDDDPSDQISGNVDFDPLEGTTVSGGDVPPVEHVWRTDATN